MTTRTLLRIQALAGSALLTGCLMTAAWAAQPMTPPATAVPFISGGVGETDRSQMNEVAEAFNLKIMTAKASGEYLAGVDILIHNDKGQPILSTVAQGPLLLAQLPPGRYTVTAMNGHDVRQEAVTIRPARQTVLRLHLDEA